MQEDNQAMDDVSKYRLTGAVIWLLLLVIIVPTWYSNPVNFKPDSERTAESKASNPVIYQAYVLPTKTSLKDSVSAKESPVIKPLNKPVTSLPAASEPVSNTVKESVSEKYVKPLMKADPASEVKVGEWLVKVYSTKEIKDANKVLGLLDDKYEVWIKEFPKSKTYSVRTGPYTSRSLAEEDKRKIDKAIRTQSKIVQVK